MNIDLGSAANLRAINLGPVEAYAKVRIEACLRQLADDLDPVATAKVRGQIFELEQWSRLSEAVERALTPRK